MSGTLFTRLIAGGIAATLGATSAVQEGFYLAILLGLFYGLYQGYGFIRWILIVLLGLGGLGGAIGAFVVIGRSPWGALWLLIMAGVYLSSGWLLWKSTRLRAFIRDRQARRTL
ncbi:MAG: hypothetical protein HC879_22260 [Leptolyngbyaceae cyanobacterium SL_5_9]|nr:hypothetical protein [Leptolyngbyaceae cyanobacterium SL_5_9]